ncbi:polyprotein of Ty1/Copia retrotransposon [Cycloclasticus sp.]|uniref:Ty1/Copia family ribonuclease HI n=1 Tax=Cycloclasticus sp. TaxID=2024830 RepID=UPI00257CD6DE|nr:polyprotein of Ty1/Copia retrotransposon [Cycloclasticus sp.]
MVAEEDYHPHHIVTPLTQPTTMAQTYKHAPIDKSCEQSRTHKNLPTWLAHATRIHSQACGYRYGDAIVPQNPNDHVTSYVSSTGNGANDKAKRLTYSTFLKSIVAETKMSDKKNIQDMSNDDPGAIMQKITDCYRPKDLNVHISIAKRAIKFLRSPTYYRRKHGSVTDYTEKVSSDLKKMGLMVQDTPQLEPSMPTKASMITDLRSLRVFRKMPDKWLYNGSNKEMFKDDHTYPDMESILEKIEELDESNEGISSDDDDKSDSGSDNDREDGDIANIQAKSRPTMATGYLAPACGFQHKGTCMHGFDGLKPMKHPNGKMYEKCSFRHTSEVEPSQQRAMDNDKRRAHHRGNPVDSRTGKQLLCHRCKSPHHLQPDCPEPWTGSRNRDGRDAPRKDARDIINKLKKENKRLNTIVDDKKRCRESDEDSDTEEPPSRRSSWKFSSRTNRFVIRKTRTWTHFFRSLSIFFMTLMIAFPSISESTFTAVMMLTPVFICMFPYTGGKPTRIIPTATRLVTWLNNFTNTPNKTNKNTQNDKQPVRVRIPCINVLDNRDRKRQKLYKPTSARIMVDSGCNASAAFDKAQFDELIIHKKQKTITGAGNITHKVYGEGTIRYHMKTTNNETIVVKIKHVRYVPTFDEIYVAVKDLTAAGFTFTSNKEATTLTKGKHTIEANLINHLPYIHGRCGEIPSYVNAIDKTYLSTLSNSTEESLRKKLVKTGLTPGEVNAIRLRLVDCGVYTYVGIDPYIQTHRLLNHPSPTVTIQYMKKYNLVPNSDKIFASWCKRCETIKIEMNDVPKKATPRTHRPPPYCRWSADITGKKVKSYNGMRYAFVFAEHTGSWKIYYMRDMTEVPQTIRRWINDTQKDMRRLSATNIEVTLSDVFLKTDSAAYFQTQEVRDILNRMGIQINFSSPHRQFQNGRAELCVKYLMRQTKLLLRESGMDDKYWPLAMDHASYVHDFMPRTNGVSSPRELRGDPDTHKHHKHLKPFGTECVTIDERNQNKREFPSRGMEGTYVGWCTETNCAKVLVHHQNYSRVYKRRDVRYNPMIPKGYTLTENLHDGYDTDECDDYHYEDDNATITIEEEEAEDPDTVFISTIHNTKPDYDKRNPIDALPAHLPPSKTFYSRKTAKEAFDPHYPGETDTAIDKEMKSLFELCLDEVDPDTVGPNEPVQRLIALYHDKRENNRHEKIKLRVVWDGANEIEGVHYHLSSSSNPRAATIRFHYALSPLGPDEISFDGDISTAYLRGELPVPPHGGRYLCKFPNDLIHSHSNGKPRIFMARTPLYGMKPAGYFFQQTLIKKLEGQGYVQCKIEPTIYYAPGIRICVYTDNVLVRALPAPGLEFKLFMEKTFGDMSWRTTTKAVGFEITKRSDGYHSLSQAYYPGKLADEFGLANANTVKTPLPTGCNITKKDRSPDNLGLTHTIQTLIGALNYLAVFSRPDISHAMSLLGQVMSSPMPMHVAMCKRVIRYLKHRPNMGLKYSYQSNNVDQLSSYSDASFAKQDDYHSQAAYAIYMNGAPIDWGSNVQTEVGQSTFETELRAINRCCRRTMYFRNLSNELGYTQLLPTPVYTDATTVVRFAANQNVTKRNLHLGVMDQYCRTLMKNRNVVIQHCPTTEMPVDIGTKQTDAATHNRLTDLLLTPMS